MPNVLRSGAYRFFFFSREDDEPPHVHVETAENAEKFWLSPIRLEWAIGYTSKELRRVRELAEENEGLILEKWHEHFRAR